MHLTFIDIPAFRDALKPFTLTRPVATLRVGIRTLGEKWQMRLAEFTEPGTPSHLTVPYLQRKYPLRLEADQLIVNPAVCPTDALIDQVLTLKPRAVLCQEDCFIATRMPGEDVQALIQAGSLPTLPTPALPGYRTLIHSEPLTLIRHPWDIFLHNGDQIHTDYHWLTRGRSSGTITDVHTRTYGDAQIFVEEGVEVRAAILNAESGPIYLGKNAMIHENAVIKGPFAMLEASHVNMGAKIREATTIGPHSKLGGEVKNTVIQAHSNKGHEGFIGNSVIGEWCNFGADTNTSNLKNNYQSVRLWDYRSRRLEDTGQTFCGLMMGDHSKCGINSMFNTGTVVGVFANLFGGGFLPKFVPSFSWGGSESLEEYRFEKAVEVLERVLARRNQTPAPDDLEILEYLSLHRGSELA